jgi:uncharacterized protein YdhG (YjbR/CyaY superfamily)
MKSYKTISEYISSFPKDIQEKLKEMHTTIKSVVPDAEEAISYGMPTFKLNGKNLVHFAAFKNHIGFYPTPNGIVEFQKNLAPYATSKGAAQFPFDKKIPVTLVKKITKFRVKENLAEAKK